MAHLTLVMLIIIVFNLAPLPGLGHEKCAHIFAPEAPHESAITEVDREAAAAYDDFVDYVKTYAHALPKETADQLQTLIGMSLVQPVPQRDALNLINQINTFIATREFWGMTDAERTELARSALSAEQQQFIANHPLFFNKPMPPSEATMTAWLTEKFIEINDTLGRPYDRESLLFVAYQYRDLPQRDDATAQLEAGRAYARLMRQKFNGIKNTATVMIRYYDQHSPEPVTELEAKSMQFLLQRRLLNSDPETLRGLGSLLRTFLTFMDDPVFLMSEFPEPFFVPNDFWQRRARDAANKLKNGHLDMLKKIDQILAKIEREAVQKEEHLRTLARARARANANMSANATVPQVKMSPREASPLGAGKPPSNTDKTINIPKRWMVAEGARPPDPPIESTKPELIVTPQFGVSLLPRVEDKLRKLRNGPGFTARFNEMLKELRTNPGELKNPRIPDTLRVYGFSYNAVSYRVLYHLDTRANKITVIHFDTRGAFYNDKNTDFYRQWASQNAQAARRGD